MMPDDGDRDGVGVGRQAGKKIGRLHDEVVEINGPDFVRWKRNGRAERRAGRVAVRRAAINRRGLRRVCGIV